MHKRQHRAGRETDILKAEPDVEQHADRRDEHRDHSVCPHLGADCGADILCRDLLGHTEVFLHISLECFTFVEIQCLSLEHNLVRSLDCLYLDISVPCDVLQLRDHLAVDLIQSIFFIKCHGGRRTACEIKAVIHSPDAARLVDPHAHKSADAQQDRDNEEDLSPSDEVDGLPRRLDASVNLRVSDPQRVE